MNEENERNHGPQPIDAIMARWGISNHDLVDISTEQLTHKQVQKARQGRQLTLKLMQKVGRALRVIYGPGGDLASDAGRRAAIAAGPKPFGVIADHAGNGYLPS